MMNQKNSGEGEFANFDGGFYSEDEMMAAEPVELEKINISIQPAYHGIPVYLGIELGLYEQVGLEVDISVASASHCNNKIWLVEGSKGIGNHDCS